MSAAPEEMDRSDRFQQVCQEFRECVKLADTSNGVRYDSKAGGNNDFLRRGQERHIITEEKLTRIVFGSLIPLDSAEQIREACDKVLTGLRIILLTILTCGGTLQMLDRFREHFLDAESSKTDEDLPFDVDYAKNIFGDLDGKKFYSIQLRYTAITLQEQTFHQEYRTDQILPYLSEKPLGRGTSGTVWQVRIERGHFRHHAPESHNADIVTLARKDFKADKQGYGKFQAEDAILETFINSSDCPSSIVTSICSTVHTRNSLLRQKYPFSSIFFLPARCNLTKYITETKPIQSSPERRQNFNQMISICKGLKWLGEHNIYVTSDDRHEYATYYHRDLKPDNILVYGNSSDGSLVFKIHDFGEAQLLRKTLEPQASFDRMTLGKTNSTPARGGGTYVAPESHTQAYSGNRSSKKQDMLKSDVWSFGCILLLVILFGYEGESSVTRFEEDREKSSDMNPRSDYFCETTKGQKVCNAAVMACIIRLMVKTERRDDSLISHKTLQYIKDHILIPHERRDGISDVLDKLVGLYNAPQRIQLSSVDRNDPPRHSKWCVNSPAPGNRILFYSDTSKEVKVYDHDKQNAPVTLLGQTWEGEWDDSITSRSKACSGKSLCVVLKPKEGKGHGIFRRHAVLHSYDELSPQRIPIGDSKTQIDRVALSPDGEMISIVRREGPKPHQARVLLFRCADLQDDEHQSVKGSDSDATQATSVTTTIQSMPDMSLGIIKGDRGLIEDLLTVVDVCFSSDNQVLYCAYKVKPKHAGAPCDITVCGWRTVSGAEIKSCPIADTHPDFRGPFITNITPWIRGSTYGFMYVAHERYIGKQTVRGDFFLQGLQVKLPVSHIKKILVSTNAEKVVMLSQPGNSFTVHGAYFDKLMLPRELQTREQVGGSTVYNIDKDSACLLESDDGRMELLLTSLELQRTTMFRLDSLFTPA